MPAEPGRAFPILRAGLTLAGVAAAVVLLLSLVHRATETQIARNQQAWFRSRLTELLPPTLHDNDLLADHLLVTAPEVFGTSQPVSVYRARRDGEPVAAIFMTRAPDGYAGPIDLMVAVAADGEVIGVEVLRHRETPGLGDAFEPHRSDWLESFIGRSLGDPPARQWTVRKDGGAFDQFTGATITPRAIVGAVRRVLEYFERDQARLFAAPATEPLD